MQYTTINEQASMQSCKHTIVYVSRLPGTLLSKI